MPEARVAFRRALVSVHRQVIIITSLSVIMVAWASVFDITGCLAGEHLLLAVTQYRHRFFTYNSFFQSCRFLSKSTRRSIILQLVLVVTVNDSFTVKS